MRPMFLAAEGEEPSFSGAAVRIALEEPFYVGLGVCAHNKDVTETAVFSNVELTAPRRTGREAGRSSTARSRRRRSPRRIAAWSTSRPRGSRRPNWLRGRQALIYNSGGRIYRIPAAGGEPEAIDTGFATRCNNDHGVSPDGTLLAISDQSQGERQVAHLHAADRRRDAQARHAERARRTGTAGRPTARRWPIAASAAASSTSTPSPPRAARRPG